MTIETDIRKAMFDFVSTSGIVAWLAPNLPVKFPDISFQIPEAGERRYIEVTHFSNETNNYDLADDNREYVGILQIALIDPTQLGEVQASRVTSQIAAKFAKDTQIREGEAVVKITRTPALLSVVEDGRGSIYPVSIAYRCST